MYNGKPSQGKEFYIHLSDSEVFTSELGKVTLASRFLEAEIIKFIQRNKIQVNPKTSTLGRLIRNVEENNLLDNNNLTALKQCKDQRNEFIHKLYSLFSGLIEQELLPINDLLDSDVITYKEYARQRNENLEHLAGIISVK
jgi:hypothetical protein